MINDIGGWGAGSGQQLLEIGEGKMKDARDGRGRWAMGDGCGDEKIR
jgi:hypothetical protein